MTGAILKLQVSKKMSNKIEKSEKIDFRDVLWNNYFEQLKKFKKQYGHCDVPRNVKRFQTLASWCNRQRVFTKYQRLRVLDERIKKLNSIGFCWSLLDKFFNRDFEALKNYHKEHGHCKVPQKQYPALFKWCVKLRQERKKKEARLTLARIKRLDSLNFEWERIDDRWITSYKALKKYVEKRKKNFVFRDRHKYKKISSFICNCRTSRKTGKLTKDQLYLLNKIGFVWDLYDTRWEQRFEELKQYKKLFGHCNVSKGKQDKDYPVLSEWAIDQRRSYKKKSKLLSSEKIKKLSSIGFNWKASYKPGEQNRIKDIDMLNELKRLQVLLGKTPSILDINKYGKYNSVSYYNHFGGIRIARKKAGLKEFIQSGPKKQKNLSIVNFIGQLTFFYIVAINCCLFGRD